jgi:hypothetical protein
VGVVCGLPLPAAENEPTPHPRLPPRETRTELRRRTARTSDLHGQQNALEIERGNHADERWHPEHDASATEWLRARDVFAGEDAVKAAGEKYLSRLDSQTDEEFAAYVKRASFFNASARTGEAYLGLIFRRPPFVKLPDQPEAGSPKSEARNPKAYGSRIGQAMEEFANDVDMLGTSLTAYAKMVAGDVIGVGRAGTLVDWEQDAEQRAYATYYRAEQIINWRVERVNGRNVPTLIALREVVVAQPSPDDDGFALQLVDQNHYPITPNLGNRKSQIRAWGCCSLRAAQAALRAVDSPAAQSCWLSTFSNVDRFGYSLRKALILTW